MPPLIGLDASPAPLGALVLAIFRARRVLAPRCALVIAAAFLIGCNSVQTQRRRLTDPSYAATLDKKSPFLKAHMRDGRVYVLSQWTVDTLAKTVAGEGEQLDINRATIATGSVVVPLDSVALFETNVVRPHPSVRSLAIMTGVSLTVTAACLISTKTCFGSCPTFYVSDGDRAVLQAEGFSASIAPALEATDVDALYLARPSSRTFEVRMTNEALETHVVRWVRVLAVARPVGGRVLATQAGEFWRVATLDSPERCSAPEGDCLPSVRNLDGTERFSTTDSTNLATREVIELEFAPSTDSVGLVIGSRQTLLSTYVLYQALAYMGRTAGAFLAALERGDATAREHARGIGRALGGIEVQARDSTGTWVTIGETQETGPLATDVRVVPLHDLPRGTTQLRLRLTRGHWRIDYIALARLAGRVSPLRLDPVVVRRDGRVDAHALALLADSSGALTTYPGDEYTLTYQLPDDFARYELFLESRGYYLEWLREEWMAEESPARAAMMLFDPETALRELAPEFKKHEADMESSFWRSRYVRR
jgi:hypothetical protein